MEEILFTGNNHEVCAYCRHIGLYDDHSRDSYAWACTSNKDSEGRYRNTKPGGKTSWDPEAINSLDGCEKFDSSRLPAHPSIIKKLILRNSLTVSIPIDSEAIETGYKFDEKMRKFPYALLDDNRREIVRQYPT